MGKNKHKNKHQAFNPQPPQAQPTGEKQVSQAAADPVADAEASLAGMDAGHGAPEPTALPEPVKPDPAQALRQLGDLLKRAQGHYDKAKELEGAARQSRESSEKSARDLSTEKKSLKVREDKCAQWEVELQTKNTAMIEREQNAEVGFRDERKRCLEPLQQEIEKQRKALESLLREIVDKRETCDSELTALRAKKFDALAGELSAERERAEQAWMQEISRRRADMDKHMQALRDQVAANNNEKLKLQKGLSDLHVEQEILQEAREDLRSAVERRVQEQVETLQHELDSNKTALADARKRRDEYHQQLQAHGEFERRFGGKSPEDVLAERDDLLKQRADLTKQLRERPAAGMAEKLSELEQERSAWLEERARLQADLAAKKAELHQRRADSVEWEGLRRVKEALETKNTLLEQALEDLDGKVKDLTQQDDHKNPMVALTRMDDDPEFRTDARTAQLPDVCPIKDGRPTKLEAFAEDLRHRIARGIEGRTLYYTARDVRSFLGGLALDSRLVLLQGISGTGKTSLPRAFAQAVGGTDAIVEVQAGWRDRQDLVGYYNAFHRHFYATNFLQALYKAGTPYHRDRVFMIVLDEMNLSRAEQFFADFLSACELEQSKRQITLVPDPLDAPPKLMREGRHLPIPPNVWFVGTANHDESTAEFADKTYDRAHVMEMPRKTTEAQFTVNPWVDRPALSCASLQDAFAKAGEQRKGEIKTATEWLHKAGFVGTLTQLGVGWGNRLEKQVAQYLPVVVECGGTMGEAMDHLVATKILRKLKGRHDVLPTALEKLRDQILASWNVIDPKGVPDRCDALIGAEIRTKQGDDRK